MSKFKVGQRVVTSKFKTDFHCTFLKEMEKYNGKIGVIVESDFPKHNLVLFSDDKKFWYPDSALTAVVTIGEDAHDAINPKHYKNYPIEVIDMMISNFGKEATASYCLITAFKYRMRMGTKEGNPVEQDLKKEKWYLDKYKELSSK